MIRTMDGVRRTSALPLPTVALKTRPATPTLQAQPRRTVVGMDGLRRPAPLSPREVVANLQAPVAVMAQAPAAPGLLRELTF